MLSAWRYSVAEGSLIHREASVTAMTLTSFQTHKTNKI